MIVIKHHNWNVDCQKGLLVIEIRRLISHSGSKQMNYSEGRGHNVGIVTFVIHVRVSFSYGNTPYWFTVMEIQAVNYILHISFLQ